MSRYVKDGPYDVLGHQAFADLSSAVALTVPAGTLGILISVETKSVRWRADGTDPTTTVGVLIPAGEERYYPLSAASLADFRFIETEATATASVVYVA